MRVNGVPLLQHRMKSTIDCGEGTVLYLVGYEYHHPVSDYHSRVDVKEVE